MSDNFKNLISTFIEQSIPEHIRLSSPMFVEYLKAFYEFLEQEGYPIERIAKFHQLRDIDFTEDKFFTLFKSTFLSPLPENFKADRKLVLKHIKDLYASKGSEKSIKLLFRILYGEEIDIFLPKTKILRASDGKWQKNISIFVEPQTGDVFQFEQNIVIGLESGATAEVELVEKVEFGSYIVYQMFLKTFDGTFKENETITIQKDKDNPTITAKVYGLVRGIEIVNSGDDYRVGDPINIIHATGYGATAEVSKVEATNPILSFNVYNGGDNYRVGDLVDFSQNGGNGIGAIAKVKTLNVTSSQSVVVTTIGEHQNVILSTVANIAIQDYVDFLNIDKGGIDTIEVIEGGKFYPSDEFLVDIVPQTPTYGLETGSGAIVTALTDNTGKILEAKITNHGVGYDQTTTADFTIAGDGTATGNVIVNGGAVDLGGFYRNTDGHLSSDMVLQDNVYYQNYSYVIKTNQNINDYRQIVKNVTHPAGYALFGEIQIINDVQNVFRINTLPIEKRIVNSINNPSNAISYEENVVVGYWESYLPCQEYTVTSGVIGDYATHLISFYQNVQIQDLMDSYPDPCYRQMSSVIVFS